MRFHKELTILLTSLIIPLVTQAESLSQPTYPCQVASVDIAQTAPTGSEQVVRFQITYATTEPIDIALYLNDQVTREPIDIDTIVASGDGEQTIALQFITAATVGTQQLVYEVNYYSVEQQQEVSCENGADIISLDITEPTVSPVNGATLEVVEPKVMMNSSVQTETKTETADTSNWPLIGGMIGGGLFIGVGLWWISRKTKPHKAPSDTTKPVPPVVAKPGAPTKKYVCTCTLSIEAPSELAICTCWESPMTFNFPGGESNKAFLDINDLQKKKTHMFQAIFTPHCAGTARNISYTWDLRNVPQANKPIPEYLELECAASYDATLPNGKEVHVTCGAVKKIKLVQYRCEINIIYVAGAARDIGYGHVAMEISCGPNDVIYGYYSANDSLSGPGQVVSNDDSGEAYENFYPDYRKTVYNITKLNKGKRLSCDQCRRLVNFWQFLAQDPGMYGGDNTCTTRLADALEAIGLVDIKNFKKSFWGPVVGTNDMATSYPSQFISVLFEGSDPDAIYEPVTKKE